MPSKKQVTVNPNGWYGWMPDRPDQRDRMYGMPITDTTSLPSSVDMRHACPPIYDQGNLGSCTANAWALAYSFERKKQYPASAFIKPSRLFIYYNERKMEGTVDSDSGAFIRDGIKTLVKDGICYERYMPYVIGNFRNAPSPSMYVTALKHQGLEYRRIDASLNLMKACLANGSPFVFGFTVYESFESDAVAKSGVVPMPAASEQVLGGHAVTAVGYINNGDLLVDTPAGAGGGYFIIANSWGVRWGQKGFFLIPYAYLTDPNLSDDRWTLTKVEA